MEIVPATPDRWDDVQTVFGLRGGAHHCQCQRIRLGDRAWWYLSVEERGHHLREQLDAGPDAPTTGALVAYDDGEPAGWVAVAPRTEFVRYRGSQVPWAGRHEDKDDDGVWAVTCFAIRKGYRGRGLMYPLAMATIDFARRHGASALEAYPMITQPGKQITWGELFVGARQVFEDAGFREVTHPSPRRVVMRIDFD
jgi:GNAT superfamily N-acetyltransferase